MPTSDALSTGTDTICTAPSTSMASGRSKCHAGWASVTGWVCATSTFSVRDCASHVGVTFTRGDNFNVDTQRALLSSYGFGIRMNLFNIAIIRWDWAMPISRPGAKGFGTWFFGASY